MSRITNLIFLLLIVSIVICYSSNAKTVDEDITKSTQQKNNEDLRNPRQRSFSIQYQDHAPIYIDSNDDFATQSTIEGWDGDGTSSTPYIIDGLEISGEPSDFASGFIDIENTDVYFQIINCRIVGKGPYQLSGNNYNGIRLYKIKNGHVSNNIVFNNGMQGIYLGFSDNTTIASNTIYQNSVNGIWVIDTDDSSIVSIFIYDNDWHGILLEDSDRNEITSNTIHDNGRNGIRLEYSNNNILIRNNVYDNGRDGLLLYTNDVEVFKLKSHRNLIYKKLTFFSFILQKNN